MSLCEYELARLANMERNASILSDVVASKTELKALTTPVRQLVIRLPRRTASPAAPARRSNRQAGKPLEYASEYIELPSQLPRKRRSATKRAKFVAPDALSEAEREELSLRTGWLEGFAAFLCDVLEDSEQNRRQVTRQANRLASGEGVPHPRSSAVFMKGELVTLGADFASLIDDAWTWENRYGEDYGHGWLLRHPLKKLWLYQAHVKEAPSGEVIAVQEVQKEVIEAKPRKATKPQQSSSSGVKRKRKAPTAAPVTTPTHDDKDKKWPSYTLNKSDEGKQLRVLAGELGADVNAMVMENVQRYPSLKASSKLKADSILFLPAPDSGDCSKSVKSKRVATRRSLRQ